MKFVYSILLLIAYVTPMAKQPSVDDPLFLHRAQQALTDVIVHDVFSPPVASRIYAYPHIAAYEILRQRQDRFVSLAQGIKNFPALPAAPRNVSLPVAAVSSFLYTAQRFVFSEKHFADSAEAILSDMRRHANNSKIFDRSVAYGQQVGEELLKWSASDQYATTRSMRRFTHSRDQGRWLPTPPAYIAAVEPHWSRMRPFVIDSASVFKPEPPCEYSFDSSSKFFQQALAVYRIANNLSTAQRDIALFWDCNPFYVNVSGHLVFATKKLSPGGHWLSIAGTASQIRGADFMTTSAAYVYTALALYDGFLSCWDEKYRSNYIRPETFINARIDESWRPLLQTPPFPEYTSGHSVISTAAATVLTALYGENFAFEDRTEMAFGLPSRSFRSFGEAAEEAAISRLYGGIHFQEAISNGQVQGQKIGDYIVSRLSITGLNP